jgi:hypothetical protein
MGLSPEEVIAAGGLGLHGRQVGAVERGQPSEIELRKAQTAKAIMDLTGLTPAQQRQFGLEQQKVNIDKQRSDIAQQQVEVEQARTDAINAQNWAQADHYAQVSQALKARSEALDRMKGIIDVGGQDYSVSDIMKSDPNFLSNVASANIKAQHDPGNQIDITNMRKVIEEVIRPFVEKSSIVENPVTHEIEIKWTQNDINNIKRIAKDSTNPQQAQALRALMVYEEMSNRVIDTGMAGRKTYSPGVSGSITPSTATPSGMPPAGAQLSGKYYQGRPVWKLPNGNAWIDGQEYKVEK